MKRKRNLSSCYSNQNKTSPEENYDHSERKLKSKFHQNKPEKFNSTELNRDRIPFSEIRLKNNIVTSESTKTTSEYDELVNSFDQITCDSNAKCFNLSTKEDLINSPSCSTVSSGNYTVQQLGSSIYEGTSPLPSLNWSNEQTLWRFMCRKNVETTDTRNTNYFLFHPDLDSKMRSILFEWILEVSAAFNLQCETYHLAIDYFDRYLSQSKNVAKNCLQLVGITCLFIASKYEEIYIPKLSQYAYVTNDACTEKDILTMELEIIKILNWHCVIISSDRWLKMLLQILYHTEKEIAHFDIRYAKFPSQLYENASRVINLCTFDDNFMKYTYKTIAVSALYLICSNLKPLNISNMTYSEISHCVTWMLSFWEVLKSQNDFTHCGEQMHGIHVMEDQVYTTTFWESICVWDTAGQERFRSMAPMYYRNANAALLVFDITQPATFNSIKSWVKELQRNVEEPLILCVVGNKTDLESQRKVAKEEAQLYATSIAASYFESSALNDSGIEDIFLCCAAGMITLSQDKLVRTLRVTTPTNTENSNPRILQLPTATNEKPPLCC